MKVKITLKRSLIGEKPKARETARSLGLKKINSFTEREVNPMICLLYTSPSPRDQRGSRMPSSA